MSQYNLLKTERNLEGATDFARVVGMPTGGHFGDDGNAISVRKGHTDREIGMEFNTGDPGCGARIDVSSRVWSLDGTHSFRTYADIKTLCGVYVAKVEGDDKGSFSEATVIRGGLRHTFSPKNAERASELILSLITKRLSTCAINYATERVATITTALDQFKPVQ